MGDLYVHVRMKECCRSTLKAVDTRKAKAKFKGGLLGMPALFRALGEKPTHDAQRAIPAGTGERAPGELERLIQAACEKVCEQHAAVHEGKGEQQEGAFWREMAAACVGTAGTE
jgi:hypothetical protein